jgi:hypothetical protein
MNKQNFLISKSAFNELCNYVCCQMQLSGSEQKDRETLNFAIYWQISILYEEQLQISVGFNSKIQFYQQLLQTRINEQGMESFDVSEIINRNITEAIHNQYPKTAILTPYQWNNDETWRQNLLLYSNKIELN